jgi:cytochrome P450
MSERTDTAPASIYGPVEDWATDIDHADPAYNPRAPEIWAELRAQGCPVAHTDRYHGMWAPITAELVREVAYDTDHFTSRAVVVSTAIIGSQAPIGAAPPITSDPPFHQLARRLLLPPFAPRKIEPWEPEVRLLCKQRLDDLGDITPGATVVDAAADYAAHIPVNVIARMLGFPIEDDDLFREFVHNTLEGVNREPEVRAESFRQLDAYIDVQVEDHRANPRDDLTSYLLEVELGDQKLSPEHVRGSIVLLLLAGIDTTWSAIGSSL